MLGISTYLALFDLPYQIGSRQLMLPTFKIRSSLELRDVMGIDDNDNLPQPARGHKAAKIKMNCNSYLLSRFVSWEQD